MPKFILGNANFVKKLGKTWTKTKPLNEVNDEEAKLLSELVKSGALVQYVAAEKVDIKTDKNINVAENANNEVAGTIVEPPKTEGAEVPLTKQQLRALEKQKADEAAAAAAAAGTNTEGSAQ